MKTDGLESPRARILEIIDKIEKGQASPEDIRAANDLISNNPELGYLRALLERTEKEAITKEAEEARGKAQIAEEAMKAEKSRKRKQRKN